MSPLLLLPLVLGCGSAIRTIAPPPAVAGKAPVPAAIDHEAVRLYLLGQVHLDKGELDAARDALARAGRHDRSSPWIRLAQGDVELAAEDLALARSLWQQAAELDPDCGPAWMRLARAARAYGDLPAARDAYQRAIDTGQGWRARAELVEVLGLLDQGPAAEVAVQAWVDSREDLPRWGLRARADARLAVGDREGAWRDLRSYLLERPEDLATLDLFLLLGDGLGRPGAAMEVVEQVARALPADPEVALREAAFYEGIGHSLRFLAAVDRLLHLTEVADPRLHLDRARINLELKRPQAALDALDDLESMGQGDWPRLTLWRAEALIQEGRLTEARTVLFAEPAQPGEVPLRARLLRELGEEDAAGQLLRETLVELPEVRPLVQAALVHAATVGDARWGRQLAGQLASDGEALWIHALFQAGRDDQAVALLQERAAAGDLEARRDLAAAAVSDHPDQAVETLQALCPQLAPDRRCRFLLAGALVEQGLQSADAGALERARELGGALRREQPHDARLLNLLAWSHAEGGDALDQGLAMAREAVALDPADPHYLDTLGWLLARTGDLRQARPLLEEAAALAPDSEEIVSHLAAVRSGVLPPPALAPRE